MTVPLIPEVYAKEWRTNVRLDATLTNTILQQIVIPRQDLKMLNDLCTRQRIYVNVTSRFLQTIKRDFVIDLKT